MAEEVAVVAEVAEEVAVVGTVEGHEVATQQMTSAWMCHLAVHCEHILHSQNLPIGMRALLRATLTSMGKLIGAAIGMEPEGMLELEINPFRSATTGSGSMVGNRITTTSNRLSTRISFHPDLNVTSMSRHEPWGHDSRVVGDL